MSQTYAKHLPASGRLLLTQYLEHCNHEGFTNQYTRIKSLTAELVEY